jgi:hypothetical protein
MVAAREGNITLCYNLIGNKGLDFNKLYCIGFKTRNLDICKLAIVYGANDFAGIVAKHRSSLIATKKSGYCDRLTFAQIWQSYDARQARQSLDTSGGARSIPITAKLEKFRDE